MDLDTTRVRELLDKRDDIDRQLTELFSAGKTRAPQKCGNCGDEGHSARTCVKPKKPE